MESVIIIVSLILLAYLIAERAFRVRRFRMETLIFFIYGIEFVLLGYVLGPNHFDVISQKLIKDIDPLLGVALGWIGMLYGMQFRFVDLKQLAPSNFFVSFFQSFLTFLIVFGITLGVGYLLFAPEMPLLQLVLLALCLGAISSPSAPTVISAVIKRQRAHGRVTRLLQYISALDALPAIAAFGVIASLLHFHDFMGSSVFEGWMWLFASLVLGGCLGFLFHLIFSLRLSENERLALIFAAIIFSSGIAQELHLSALFCNLIVGVVLANMNIRYHKIHRLLFAAEKPLYGLLLIIAAALWEFDLNVLYLVMALVVSRFVGKVFGSWISLKRYPMRLKDSRLFGTALVAQGGIAIAMALDFRSVYQSHFGDMVVMATLMTFVINGFISIFTVKHVLTLEEEVT